ncbi:arabinofuranosidase catalytic domain-containing protein [Streptomyces javensis]|uniref:arabinofuranosidase catalytic domain-containing protein n=1 Tax=Streptomyces javensis TaxID=114698 RepID=UPI003F4CFC00
MTAHSTTRALFASYDGPLCQTQRSSDHSYRDIAVPGAGGYADAASQVSFCAGTSSTITKIYDQTTEHNDLPISWGGFWKGPGPGGSDIGADAMALPVAAAGHQVSGVKVEQGVGYRIDHAKGVATGSKPEGIYMVTSSDYTNQWCCFDYGSGENSHTDTGNATMNAIYWGNACWFNGCTGNGPWVEADLENGMCHTNTGSNKDPNNTGVHYPFVSAWLKHRRRPPTAVEPQRGRHRHQRPVRPVPGRDRRSHRERHPRRTVDLQRGMQPAMVTELTL